MRPLANVTHYNGGSFPPYFDASIAGDEIVLTIRAKEEERICGGHDPGPLASMRMTIAEARAAFVEFINKLEALP